MRRDKGAVNIDGHADESECTIEACSHWLEAPGPSSIMLGPHRLTNELHNGPAVAAEVLPLDESDEDLTQFSGMGGATASAIREIVTTGALGKLEKFRADVDPVALHVKSGAVRFEGEPLPTIRPTIRVVLCDSRVAWQSPRRSRLL
jgi:hypothetical protein